MKKAAFASSEIKTRLLDWWQGNNRLGGGGPKVVDVPLPEPVDEEEHEFRWTAPRISLNHRIWGPGFIGPGGPEYTLELVRPAAVDASQSLLDFNSGLGGPAAVIAKAYQMYVDGQEQREILVDEGLRVAKHYHVGERVKIRDFDPDEFELDEKKYFCVLSREFFYTRDNKDEIFPNIYKSIKDNGSLVFTDFIVKESLAPSSMAYKAWVGSEPEPIFPWKPSQYRDILKKLGFELRIFGDETEKFRQMALTALQNFAASLPEKPISEEQGDILLRETGIWQGRINALESDDVKLLRVHAVRKRQLF